MVDRWVNGSWRRVLVVNGQPTEITVVQKDESLLKISLFGPDLQAEEKREITATIARCLGANKDLSVFYDFAQKDKRLNFLANRFLGLKPPMFPSVFEAAVNGIACQQVSLNLGIILLNRLSAAHGLSIKAADKVEHAFPTPGDLSRLQPEDFRRLGFSRMKGRAIIELSQAIVLGGLDLEKLADLSNNEALEKLCVLRGFGRWTSQYVLLRGLGRLDVFPADDVGGQRGLQRWLKLKKALDYQRAVQIVARWRPYAGLVYFHLLLNRLVEEGCIEEERPVASPLDVS